MDNSLNLHSVDVVIPLYNKAPYIEQAIRSVQAQTIPVDTILVADDASSDMGEAIVRRLAEADSRIRWIASPYATSSGPSATRNRAISKCRSAFVAFLDGDDWWEDKKLALQLTFFENPEIGLVHCGSRSVDKNGMPLSEQFAAPQPIDRSTLFDAVRLGRYPVTGSASGVVIRRSVLDDVGGFLEHLRFGEDWDLWSRVAERTAFGCARQPLTNIRVLTTYARTLGVEEEFFLWLRVFDRWEKDTRFMALACREARTRAVSVQLELFWRRRIGYLAIGFPLRLKKEGGPLGSRAFSSSIRYRLNLYRLVPHILRGILRRMILGSYTK